MHATPYLRVPPMSTCEKALEEPAAFSGGNRGSRRRPPPRSGPGRAPGTLTWPPGGVNLVAFESSVAGTRRLDRRVAPGRKLEGVLRVETPARSLRWRAAATAPPDPPGTRRCRASATFRRSFDSSRRERSSKIADHLQQLQHLGKSDSKGRAGGRVQPPISPCQDELEGRQQTSPRRLELVRDVGEKRELTIEEVKGLRARCGRAPAMHLVSLQPRLARSILPLRAVSASPAGRRDERHPDQEHEIGRGQRGRRPRVCSRRIEG